jgi:hypothetical protein
MLKNLAALLCAFLLTACGGGGDDGPAPAKPEREPLSGPQTLYILGNSVTSYGIPIPADGWFGTWGMAATAPEKDFAHLTAAAVNAALVIRPSADVELRPADAHQYLDSRVNGIDSTSLVVIQLADNARAPLEPFRVALVAILERVKVARRLVCVGTWWPDPQKDALVKSECESRGGTFVYIGDLKAKDVHLFEYPGWSVNEHPHDWGMARIAERVTAALR